MRQLDKLSSTYNYVLIENAITGIFASDYVYSELLINYRFMEMKNSYCAPECEVVEMRVEGVICQSIVDGMITPPDMEDGGNLPF